MPRFSKRFLLAGIITALALVAPKIHWNFLHSVTTATLMQVAKTEFDNHWSVRNTGKSRDAFLFTDNAAQWAELRKSAEKWFQQVAITRGDRTIDDFPNTLWKVRLKNPERIDGIRDVVLQVEVFVDAIDCYSKVVSEGLCPGIPHRTSREIVFLTFAEIDSK